VARPLAAALAASTAGSIAARSALTAAGTCGGSSLRQLRFFGGREGATAVIMGADARWAAGTGHVGDDPPTPSSAAPFGARRRALRGRRR